MEYRLLRIYSKYMHIGRELSQIIISTILIIEQKLSICGVRLEKTEMTHSVLLVDDEQGVCAALKRTFRNTVYNVLEANSGDQALTLLANNNVDVVISDQRMPDMNGTELLTIVKDKYPKIGRVMLSAHSDFEALTGAINEACIFRFIPKPWDDKELLQTVDASITNNHTQPPVLRARKETIYRSLNIYQQATSPVPSTLFSIKSPETLSQPNHQKKTTNTQPLFLANNTGEPFLKKQMQLEQDIKNDELNLTQSSLVNIESGENTLHYLLLNWPRYEHFTHDHIIDMAKEAGYLKELYTWYSLKCDDTDHTKGAWQQSTAKKIVIDLFYEQIMNETLLRKPLLSMAKKNCHLVFRTHFPLYDETCLHSLLEETHLANSSIMLKIGKRIIDVNELDNTYVKYLELDARYNTIRNTSLTEKRMIMLKDAKNRSIKTILTEVNDNEQVLYAKQMKVDFFSSKLNTRMDIK